ncbi:NAD-dependent deacetylase [Algoriphagus ornithinivorans]|uniref:NAD-dependent protein deacylase n=1 Tax=Algoriphagus ornithinivorans TaxID=226506 RepID=A0A1I5J2G4_9BACT|nr:NAD-dependent deacylase [Algoriphagus ornithinivorans]SFO66823.1 NAD-dependent deacetylase [Algoriphagus ornithinivorans]
MEKLVVLSGAGVSAESGIKTFRDSGGLWEGHDVMEVASPEGWRKNQDLVQDFYNQRRKQMLECQPNLAHQILVELEDNFDVQIITQNVDDLHERAGSKNVLHLHGELRKAQSSLDPNLVYALDHWEIKKGDKCERGSQLRPNVVWFGEPVPKMLEAIDIAQKADIFLIIGTSLQVYPAASIVDYTPSNIPIYLIDPNSSFHSLPKNLTHFQKSATEGMKILKEVLLWS